MRNRKRLTNMLIAGTLTVFLAFRGSGTAVAESIPEPVTNIDTTNTSTLQAQIQNLQAQNDQLRTAVTTMQGRESEYQSQIESANQTINELSSQNGRLALGGEGFSTFTLLPRPHSHDDDHFERD